jgi:hypothetical protein
MVRSGRVSAMIPVSPSLSSLALLPLAIIVFLLPGWLLHRRIRSPAPEATIFLGSAALLALLVFGFALARLPLARGPLLAGWGAMILVVAWCTRTSPVLAGRAEPVLRQPGGTDWLWLAVAAIGLLAIVLRAVLDPLSGYDNGFRWDYLARAMLAYGRLDFYPPVTAGDFDIYPWCDGIPPLVSSLNFWIYLFTGSNAPALTATRVGAEAILVFCVVARLARELWGENGGTGAVAAAASSALLLWAIAMGQETGLTTLTLTVMLHLLLVRRRTEAWSAVFWAGVAAGCGALSREYGLAFLLFGGGVLLAGRDIHGTGWFVATAGIIAGPWYLRNWVMTGNPLFPHALGGLFPTNLRYAETMQSVFTYWKLGANHAQPAFLVQLLAVLAGGVLLIGAAGAGLAGRKALPVVSAIFFVLVFWLWSLQRTAGGWVYALRVLAPALALAAALGGWLSARLSRRWQVVAAAAVLMLTVDAARRSWHLPALPFISPWNFSLAGWRDAQLEIQAIRGDPVWPALIAAAEGEGIVVDHPANHAEITIRGGQAVPLFSPRLSAIYDESLSFDAAVGQLRAAHVRLVTLTLDNEMVRSFVRSHPFLRELSERHAPLGRVGMLTIFDLKTLTPGTVASR